MPTPRAGSPAFTKILVCLLVGILVAGALARAGDRPAVLVCSPAGAWQGSVDLNWLKELHEAGFAPDYLDAHTDFSWERVRQYNCLVLYGAPAAGDEKGWGFPAAGPRLDEYVAVVERFLEAGGGVFMMVDTNNADEHVKPLIERWGARLPYEIYVEEDPEKLAPMPRMRGQEMLSLTDQVLPSPISAGVERLWLPYGERYSGSWSAPIAVSEDWQVVVKGSRTSRSQPVEEAGTSHAFPRPPDALVRPGGVPEPDLMALRSYGKGRLVLLCQGPVWSIGQGTQWLYNRRVLSRGLLDVPSDFERLVVNAFRWLSAPSLASGAVGGYETDPQRFVPPNLRPGVKADFERTFWSAEELDRHRSPKDGPIYRGLIGARSSLTGGGGTVAEYAAAARQARLDFVVFLDPFTELTPELFAQLQAECRTLTADDLLLIPGYRIDTNTNNHMFFAGWDLPWPRDNVLTPPDRQTMMIQFQNEAGEYVKGPNTYLQWVLYEHERYKGQMVGYYLFDDPRGQQVTDLRLSSAVGVKTYVDGKLVDDRVDEYLLSAAGTLASLPVAVDLVDSPAALIAAVAANQALTYAQGRKLPDLAADTLRWNSQYDGMNVSVSDGPVIRSWPHCYRAYTYGAEPFVVNSELMPTELHVTSAVGLREIRVMNAERMVRRFLPNGAKEFRRVLNLAGHIQQNLVAVARDVNGGEAVSFSLRCWRPGSFGIAYCGDHVNDCGRQYLARGMGTFQVHRFPLLDGGFTWDGGPKGERPVIRLDQSQPRLTSDLGEEGGKAFNNIPILEFSDDQAVVVRSVMQEVYDPAIPALNAWYTYAPKDPSKLIDAVRTYTEFNRPLEGPRPTGWAAIGVRSGAVLANFTCTVRFKQGQTVHKLELLRSNWYKDVPAIFVAGRGDAHRSYYLGDGTQPFDVAIDTGAWFGFYTRETYNQVLFINRGDPLRVQIYAGSTGSFFVSVLADIAGKAVAAGDEFHGELFSVNEPLDCPGEGPARFRRVRHYLDQPDGVEILAGQRHHTLGFFDVRAAAADQPVELRLPRPATPVGLTVPVRVLGLNPNWSAGLYQLDGHTTGFYTDGEEVYTTLGFDFAGRAYAALYPDRSETTHVVIGHPIVCTRPELILEVMPGQNEAGEYRWHVAVNNPTDEAVEATFRQGMNVRGLAFHTRELTIPAGGHLLLQP